MPFDIGFVGSNAHQTVSAPGCMEEGEASGRGGVGDKSFAPQQRLFDLDAEISPESGAF